MLLHQNEVVFIKFSKYRCKKTEKRYKFICSKSEIWNSYIDSTNKRET